MEHYCREQGYEVDPWRFLDYYGALGWRLGNTPIRDWKALIRRWDDPKEHIPGRMVRNTKQYGEIPAKAGNKALYTLTCLWGKWYNITCKIIGDRKCHPDKKIPVILRTLSEVEGDEESPSNTREILRCAQDDTLG